MDNKICNKCGGEYPATSEFFHKHKNAPDGLRYSCKVCAAAAHNKWYQNNKDRAYETSKRWAAANREYLTALKYEYNKRWIKDNRERYLARANEYNRKYYRKNIEKQREYHRNYKREWGKDPKNRLRDSMASAVYRAVRDGKMGRRWEDLVGYTTQDLVSHLENKFSPGMSWDNYGEWHVDHIIPVTAFNFSDPAHDDFKRCWSLKNLQPMWAKENHSKGNHLDTHFQPHLALEVA
jgi:hypothetical protein